MPRYTIGRPAIRRSLVKRSYKMEHANLAFIGGLGLPEILVIGTIAVLLFGTKKLPELGRGLAKGIKEFKDGLKDEDSSSSKKDSTKKE